MSLVSRTWQNNEAIKSVSSESMNGGVKDGRTSLAKFNMQPPRAFDLTSDFWGLDSFTFADSLF